MFLAGMLDAAGNLTPAATFSNGVYIPEYLFAAFQMTFAAHHAVASSSARSPSA